MMDWFEGLDYRKFADMLDVISWDAYPTWHDTQEPGKLAAWFSFNHDLFRSLKGGRPFMLMESTPSLTNWQPVSKLKRPGMHLLSSLQAVAHGSDTVQYFQWRKSRGSSEKFHGAVVDHVGHEHTRVFRDVAELGGLLETIAEVTYLRRSGGDGDHRRLGQPLGREGCARTAEPGHRLRKHGDAALPGLVEHGRTRGRHRLRRRFFQV